MEPEIKKIIRKNGRLLIYQRRDCGNRFYCRMKFRDLRGFIRKSLWTKIESEAIESAEKLYDELNFKASKGLSINVKKFSRLCKEFLSYLKEQVEIGTAKEKKYRDYQLISNRYLLNYFGKKDSSKITDKDVTLYREWRNAYWITGEGSKIEYIEYQRSGKTVRCKARHLPPSTSTLNAEETVLRQILEYGVKKGNLSRLELPTIKSKRVKSNRRPAFSLQEYRKIRSISNFRIKNAPYLKVKRQRELLHDYILIMANTGMRPIEAKTLRWKDIQDHISPESGEKHILLSVRGKNKKRDLVAQPITRIYLNRLRQRQEQFALEHGFILSKEDYVFSDEKNNQIKSFKLGFTALLKEAEALYDNQEQKRSVYSLRHLYGTFRLLYGNVDVFFLAENMGTSVEMIKKHYSHVKVTQIADRLVQNVKRKKKRTQETF